MTDFFMPYSRVGELAGLRPYLLRVARSRLRDEHRAEDVVQETLLAAIRSAGTFAGRSRLRTWVTGILLLGLVYYMGGALLDATSTMSVGTGAAIGLVLLVVGFAVYDALWKSPLGKQPMAGSIVSLVLLAAVAWWLSTIFSGRAIFIHVGALLGTIMAANVWMRIWPAQQKIITAIRDGQAPDGALVARAGQRSRHNTYMSVPLVWTMINSHTTVPFASTYLWLIFVVGVAWGGTILLYKKAAAVKGF
jgi:uncharacterized membrane protein